MKINNRKGFNKSQRLTEFQPKDIEAKDDQLLTNKTASFYDSNEIDDKGKNVFRKVNQMT